MKISTRGRYALRLMLDLAVNDLGMYIPLKAVAERQDISDKYLEQIIHQLSKANLVVSARGAQGGYKLAKHPDEYTVGEILRTVEGSLAPVACLECGTPCSRAEQCIAIGFYKKIQDAVDDVVNNTTLADMINDFEKKL